MRPYGKSFPWIRGVGVLDSAEIAKPKIEKVCSATTPQCLAGNGGLHHHCYLLDRLFEAAMANIRREACLGA
jgi:hypothetical protein